MNLAFTSQGWQDYLWFQKNERQVLRRINRVIEDTLRHPTSGLGKPEQLRGNLSGFWSRRITQEHRLVYAVEKSQIVIISCRFHYES